MGSTALVVHLRSELTPAQARDLLAAAARSLGLPLVDRPGSPDHVTGVRLPNGYELDCSLYPGENENEPGELDVLAGLIGYRPVLSLAVGVGTRDASAARLLASLVVGVAEATESFIDLNGALWPPDVADTGVDLADEIAITRAYLAGRPGRVVEVPYASVSGPSFSHVVDAEFLRGWLADPDFSLVS